MRFQATLMLAGVHAFTAYGDLFPGLPPLLSARYRPKLRDQFIAGRLDPQAFVAVIKSRDREFLSQLRQRQSAYLSDKKITSLKRHAEIFFFGEENLWITAPYNSYAFNDTAMCVYEKWDSFGTFHLAHRADMEDGVVNAVFLDGQVKTVNRVDSWRYCAPNGQDLSPLKD